MTGPDSFFDKTDALESEIAHLKRRIQRRDNTIDTAHDYLERGQITNALTYLTIAREAKS